MPKRSSSENSSDRIAPGLSTRAIVVFLSLQALDVITTLLGLRTGAQEANIVIVRLLDFGPMWGLLIAKFLGLLIIIIAVFMCGKVRLIRLLNLLFAGIVTWNLIIIWLQRLVVPTK